MNRYNSNYDGYGGVNAPLPPEKIDWSTSTINLDYQVATPPIPIREEVRIGMTRTRMNKQAFAEFLASAGDSITTLQTDFGTYAAIVTIDGQDYEAETQSLDPTADGFVRPVTREEAERMIMTDYRTVLRR